MVKANQVRVMVLYGGRSGEHEISLLSAASVIRHLDPTRFEIIPVAIDRSGQWTHTPLGKINSADRSLPILPDAPRVFLPPYPSSRLTYLSGNRESIKIDVVFPVMHGPFCEDGTLQGLLELAAMPYVGCGVLASAVGMDKDFAKRLVRDRNLPIVPFITLKKEVWNKNQAKFDSQILQELGLPLFVKPANLGSSVGVHKVGEIGNLRVALEDAFQYDSRVLVEKAITAREIEFAVLENPDVGEPPLVSLPGEIIPRHEFYSYDAKYLDEKGADLLIPAKLSATQTEMAQKIAREAFETLGCEGMARVDLFLDKNTGEFYFNEVNTIPGFTSISMYPKMWEASGITYRDLLSRLVDLALARQERKNSLRTEFHPN